MTLKFDDTKDALFSDLVLDNGRHVPREEYEDREGLRETLRDHRERRPSVREIVRKWWGGEGER